MKMVTAYIKKYTLKYICISHENWTQCEGLFKFCRNLNFLCFISQPSLLIDTITLATSSFREMLFTNASFTHIFEIKQPQEVLCGIGRLFWLYGNS